LNFKTPFFAVIARSETTWQSHEIASGYRPRNDGEVRFKNLSREESKILFTGFSHFFIWSFNWNL